MNQTELNIEVATDAGMQILRDALAHMAHVLPDQGPILDFVHHNTIHGFQHLPFFEALAAFEKLTGVHGYQSEARNRANYASGRINDNDLLWSLAREPALEADKLLWSGADKQLLRSEVYLALLIHPLPEAAAAQLRWHLQEGSLLKQCAVSVSPTARANLLRAGVGEAQALSSVWHTLQNLLGLVHDDSHPELETLDAPSPARHSLLPQELLEKTQTQVSSGFAELGKSLTLRTLMLQLSDVDVLDSIRPQLIRLGGSLLDEGMAAWHITDKQHRGLFEAWRGALQQDLQAALQELPDAAALVQSLPDQAMDCIHQQLTLLGLPRERWAHYLELLALELPGWSGLIHWRQRHAAYHTGNPGEPRLEDFLAIRLVLDHLFLNQLAQKTWHCGAALPLLEDYFQRNSGEYYVRHQLYAGTLPEYLAAQADALVLQTGTEAPEHAGWNALALQVWQQEQRVLALATGKSASADSLLPMFVLCQHLGLNADDLESMAEQGALETLLNMRQEFTPALRGKHWLQAYERHYRDEILAGISANHERGGWFDHTARPQAQIVMCMDEREESFRRHLEELNPRIETLGAAGFFGIPMQYLGLDAVHSTPLCPVVVTPVNMVQETIAADQSAQLQAHNAGKQILNRFTATLHQHLRLDPLTGWLATVVLMPVLLPLLLLDTLLPKLIRPGLASLRSRIMPAVLTRLDYRNPENAASTTQGATPPAFKPGFTDKEQSERVAGMLRTLGLLRNFAPIVALAGHGSTSLNNPHEAAHDCGACGGRQGGPNARTFAAMANSPAVRLLLAEQGIAIPDDTWFVGLQHDTCSDALSWYDTDLVPTTHSELFAAFKTEMEKAQQYSAHERCRRFFTARNATSVEAAYTHVTLRSQELNQVRPEYGHATNATAVIGRRKLTRGLFLDRRAFLISYDPSTDPAGKIAENILLTAGPVGAGINLEYYFSTIDNERFGCGTKIPHNVTGLCAVMEGASSDLRTGLPLQMVEIHEAMRLQVMVEASVAVLTRIYTDQPALQELVGGGWLLLTSIDPDSGAITVFEPDQGFVPWTCDLPPLQERARSMDCYQGRNTPVSPFLITPPVMAQV